MTSFGERNATRERPEAATVEAFEPLVRLNAPIVIRLAYHMLGDWDEARDLAQETFARAYLCLAQYDPARPFQAWICTIAARLATDRLRRRRIMWRANDLLASREQPRSGGINAEAMLSLKESLAQLTPRQRQAVVLCDLHGFTAAEAAAMIGCSASTVRVLRLLARRRLRDLIVRAPARMAAPVEAGE
jgi:RNA polymerase sigma-70 factor (ECF subfamily)